MGGWEDGNPEDAVAGSHGEKLCADHDCGFAGGGTFIS